MDIIRKYFLQPPVSSLWNLAALFKAIYVFLSTKAIKPRSFSKSIAVNFFVFGKN